MAFTDTFGTIKPPAELEAFTKGDLTGAAGISKFFNNFIGLIYAAATVVFILMIVWGAWDWITSGGEKDKIDAARRKIINAIVGILLFAAAFAIINTFGQFTGFTFFSSGPTCSKGQSYSTTAKRCQPICNPGETYLPDSNSCQPDTNIAACPRGEKYDFPAKRCQPDCNLIPGTTYDPVRNTCRD